ncbi:hypothetical protein SDC9_68129 [bioreactor metagenome]|uniref:Uncharacterized protein n=1 Tax=bioreactor metagenome TaxID=1076179 RepID=A0A644Y679_9ZZZZ|nr:hypothetical protein [Oscillibacter sp.]
MVKQTRPKVPLREDTQIKEFLDMIAPGIIKFQTDHFICGNTFRCVWALREYPTYFLWTIRITWLLSLTMY